MRHLKHQFQEEAGAREATIRTLVEQRDTAMTASAQRRLDGRTQALRQSEVDALRATLAQVEHDREKLRGTVTKQAQELATFQQDFATVERERNALRETVREMETTQKLSEQVREMLRSQVTGLREQLVRAEEDLKAWRRGAQFGVAKGIAETLLHLGNEYVESVNGPSPKSAARAAQSAAPVPAPDLTAPKPTAPPPTSVPVSALALTDDDRKWLQRIREAKVFGWNPQTDPLVRFYREQLEEADRQAQRQLTRGLPVTAARIPSGADVEYLAIRAAVETRRRYHREHGRPWVIKWFRLDREGERLALQDGMQAQTERTKGS